MKQYYKLLKALLVEVHAEVQAHVQAAQVQVSEVSNNVNNVNSSVLS